MSDFCSEDPINFLVGREEIEFRVSTGSQALRVEAEQLPPRAG